MTHEETLFTSDTSSGRECAAIEPLEPPQGGHDAKRGPCACGAWHDETPPLIKSVEDEPRECFVDRAIAAAREVTVATALQQADRIAALEAQYAELACEIWGCQRVDLSESHADTVTELRRMLFEPITKVAALKTDLGEALA